MTIGQRIREFRQNKKLTQDQFGEVCAATKSAVSQWENNITKPSIDNLVLLNQKLGCSIDWLLTGIGSEPPHDARSTHLIGVYSMLDDRGKNAVLRAAESEAQYAVTIETLPEI